MLGAVFLWSLLGVVCGAFPFSLWMGRLLAGADIRRYGDGNPGATNAWRAGGWRAGVPASLLDYLKAAVPVSLAHYGAGLSGWALLPVALAPVLGHAFSPFLCFRGGKALAVTFGIWTGLTLWAGPTTLGLALLLALALNSADAWSVLFSLLVLLGYLLLWRAPAPFLVIWAGNVAILVYKHRHSLRTPLRIRPWLHNLVRRSS